MTLEFIRPSHRLRRFIHLTVDVQRIFCVSFVTGIDFFTDIDTTLYNKEIFYFFITATRRIAQCSAHLVTRRENIFIFFNRDVDDDDDDGQQHTHTEVILKRKIILFLIHTTFLFHIMITSLF
jgi:hypothetical protein